MFWGVEEEEKAPRGGEDENAEKVVFFFLCDKERH
jgi:hypothetical protein